MNLPQMHSYLRIRLSFEVAELALVDGSGQVALEVQVPLLHGHAIPRMAADAARRRCLDPVHDLD